MSNWLKHNGNNFVTIISFNTSYSTQNLIGTLTDGHLLTVTKIPVLSDLSYSIFVDGSEIYRGCEMQKSRLIAMLSAHFAQFSTLKHF